MGVLVMPVVANGTMAVFVAIAIGLDGCAVSVKRVAETATNGDEIVVLVVF